ncbi:hypothetical protein PM082_007473 [Marasmius tenuissimus]|nr:hypothetical protein PM082_007473 [Marasmius tenuissimus]
MLVYNSLLALLLVATVAFAQAERSVAGSPASCSYVFTTSSSVANVDPNTELNYVIGRQIAIESPSHDLVYSDSGFTTTTNGDGSFTARGSIATTALTADQLKSLVTAWPGRSLVGSKVSSWSVDAVNCT